MAESADGPFRFVCVTPVDGLWIPVQRLRYEVYCLECGFLDPTRYPTGLESDEFDAISTHFAAVDKEEQVVATLRLVPDRGRGFPLERHARSLFPSFHQLPRDKTVEISRLILSKRYRRRSDDGRYGLGGVPADAPERWDEARRRAARRSPYPVLLFGLFRKIFEEGVKTGSEYWLAAMEPWLQTFLERFAFTFAPIGAPIDYFGNVVPYAAKIEDVFRSVAERKPEVLKAVLGAGDGPRAQV
jgi:N-acyl amino acid synthase of PEP-CTERM/exosortase system